MAVTSNKVRVFTKLPRDSPHIKDITTPGETPHVRDTLHNKARLGRRREHRRP